MENKIKEVVREPKGYVSVSTKLPLREAITLKLICNKNKTVPSEYIRELIQKNVNSPKNNFLSGKNKIIYDRINNSFSWFVQIDSGDETKVLSNLSQDFLKNIQNEIQDAIKERNQWVHQTKENSVDIPKELVRSKT
ncbi:MAG: hypothetical protein ISS82_02920 [Nanoarchaeota archaeon]|nr:hypothetical protein [Nanoarchaeota archaeon]